MIWDQEKAALQKIFNDSNSRGPVWGKALGRLTQIHDLERTVENATGLDGIED